MTKKTDRKKTAQTDYLITKEGSLGLLATGAVGLRAWRKVRDEAKEAEVRNEEK